nr:MAG TPA: hypothetical protein [Caudoviricetes sp.]
MYLIIYFFNHSFSTENRTFHNNIISEIYINFSTS